MKKNYFFLLKTTKTEAKFMRCKFSGADVNEIAMHFVPLNFGVIIH